MILSCFQKVAYCTHYTTELKLVSWHETTVLVEAPRLFKTNFNTILRKFVFGFIYY